MVDFIMEEGAPFAGVLVQSLGLPRGCVLVRCVEAGIEFVPNALTRLEPQMRITALIAPEAAGALQSLRSGCQAMERSRAEAHEI